MSRKRQVTILSVCLTSLVLLVLFLVTPLKQAWWSYLNDYASHYYVSQVATFNARKDLNLPQGAVLFYGDSLIQGLAVSSASERAVNYGIGHATSITVRQQVYEHRSIGRADAVIIAVGINDITRGKAAQILPVFRDVLESIPEDVPIIISLVMPIDESALRRPGLSKVITSVNQKLDLLCTTSSQIQCLNAGPALARSDGQLDSQYHIGDGLHLNAAGNAIWLEHLQSTIIAAVDKKKEQKKERRYGHPE